MVNNIKDKEHMANENDNASFSNEENLYKGIQKFLKKIEKISHINSKIIGNNLSGYWAPKLVKDVLRICKKF